MTSRGASISACSIACLLALVPAAFASTAYRPPVCAPLTSADDRTIDYVCPASGRLRIWVPFSAIPSSLKQIIVMLEDDKFYAHGGLDAEGIGDAMKANLKEGRLARGGSTITQQLVKNLFLTKEKSFIRKLREIPLALKLERDLTKDQILELYLNTIEWGPGVYGVEAASRLYFDHGTAELKDEEAWLLALMIPNPTELNLWVKPQGKKSLVNRAQTLGERLWREKHMEKAQADAALTRFLEFIERWPSLKPAHPWGEGRRFPALWGNAPVPGLWTIPGLHGKLDPQGDGAALATNLLWDWQRDLAELRLGREPRTPVPSPSPTDLPAAYLPSPSALDLAIHSLTSGLFTQATPTPSPTPSPTPRTALTPRPSEKKEPQFDGMEDGSAVLRALLPAEKHGALGLTEAAARLKPQNR